MKYSPYRTSVFIVSSFLLFSTASHAVMPEVSVRAGVDAVAFYDEFKSWYPGFSGRCEVIGKHIEAIPGNPEFGVGAAYQFPRGGWDLQYFIPVYSLARFDIQVQDEYSITKLVLKCGHNWYGDKYNNGDRIDYEGGIYYSIGVDRIMSKHLLLGLYYSENHWLRERMYSTEKNTDYYKYKTLNIMLGYMFR